MESNAHQYDQIAAEIHSDTSPVGIDAKKTHILIIQMLRELQSQLNRIEQRLDKLNG